MDLLIYLACFAGGAFLANGVPHFVAGISGKEFHSPFAKPPGKGYSSAVVNVIWGFINLVIAFILLKLAGAFDLAFSWKTLLIGLGALITALSLAVAFSKFDKN
jgi:hypothetical protein